MHTANLHMGSTDYYDSILRHGLDIWLPYLFIFHVSLTPHHGAQMHTTPLIHQIRLQYLMFRRVCI